MVGEKKKNTEGNLERERESNYMEKLQKLQKLPRGKIRKVEKWK